MASSSLLGIDTDNLPPAHSATGIDSLGPSDASDSGSDSAGAYSAEADSDTDRFGTGERSGVEPAPQSSARDILPDHVESAAGLDDGVTAQAGDGQRAGRAGPLGADDLPGSSDATEGQEPDDAP